jgi:hypothetical protein
VDPDSLNPDPEISISRNPDPGFLGPKILQNTAEKKKFTYHSLINKIAIYLSLVGLFKGRPIYGTGETFIPQKRTSITSTNEI